ncbi:hypothetical protein FC83_GL002101 [Agrilactobacillus composti DSM 18527 = JCM 14202]|uniref:Surface layer protein A domain-containing protein n=2 Tax=Agrilactobacillus TaxID=2767875 RepID=A0A0R1XXL0_9LACO|nr:hypothetical protein FC83_GL002101 [Agrilactobacillus composti DSM 18527 = JCM 14202]
MAVTVSTLALSGVLLSQQPTRVQASSVGTVVNPMANAPVYVYDAPGGNVNYSRTLPNGSAWQINTVQAVPGRGNWYELGPNVWINDYVFKAADTSSSSTPTTQSGVGTIANPQGDVAVYAYDKPAGSLIATQTYANGTRWQFNQVQTIPGVGTFYEIGPNIWINDYVFQVDSTKASPDTPSGDGSQTAPGTVTISSTGANLRDAPYGNILRWLDAGTTWQVTGSKTVGGVVWYQLGTAQWVCASTIDLTSPGTNVTGTPANPNQVLHLTNAAPVFTAPAPAGGGLTGQILPTNTDWRVLDLKTFDGATWALVGSNQWLAVVNGQLINA